MINRFVRLLAVGALGVLGFTPGLRAVDTPTAVRFIVGHADCSGAGTFEFFVGKTSLGVFAAVNGCYCNTTPLVVSSSDPAVLGAVGTPGCTLVTVRINDPGNSLYIGYARAEIDRSESGTEVICLTDPAGLGCADRDLCLAYFLAGTSSLKNGPDIDRDGILDSCDPEVDLPGAIALSIEDGIAWLVTQQKDNGSWGDYEPVAHTAFAVVKLEERAFELGYAGPFDDAYPYKQDVIDGLNYLFSNAATYGAGTGICFAQGGHETYSTGVSMMAIAASRTPKRIVNVPGSLVDGWTYKGVLEACVQFFAWSQNPDGGWRYVWGDRPSDNSNTGYAVLGLRYAEAPAFGFECGIPASIKAGQNAWIAGIQDPVNGDPNDGGSHYTIGGGWVNLLKTGNLLFEMSFFGDTTGTPRVKDAVAYIERHWNDPNIDPGWRPHHYQSMYCLMKGLASFGIDTLTVGGSPVDWYKEFAIAILDSQLPGGDWPSDLWGDKLLSTAWALLVLEKVAPPPPVDITVDVPDCACDNTGYDVTVTYTVERIEVDGTVTVSRDGVLVDTLLLTSFKGTATATWTLANEAPGDHVWRADIDVSRTGGGGTPAHADDKDSIHVCEAPQVSGIPDQIAPFVPFDLDNYLIYGGGLPVSWAVSGVPAGWTVTIDANNVVIVTPPGGTSDPADLTFTASITCCEAVVCSGSDTAKFTPNQPPDCSLAAPSVAMLWPPNNKFVAVQVLGVTDPDGDPITITITSIRQDEKVDTYGDGNFTPDGQGVGTSTAWLRAERSGTAKVPGNGRVYHVAFTASDGRGGVCEGVVRVGVPHDVKDTPVDGGPLYDSTALMP